MTIATARITRTVADFRKRLLQREQQAVTAMQRYHDSTIAHYIQPKLNKLYDEILKKQEELLASREEGETGPPKLPQHWITERLRLESIQLLISGHIDNFGALALQETRRLQHLGVQLGLQSGRQQLHDVIPAQVKSSFGIPSTKALESLVGATQAGSPLSDLFNGFGSEAATKVTQALVGGVTLGNNPRQITRDVQQALGISRNRALVISRTESLRCYRSANLETYRANDDVVGGWIWSADLGPRSCAACIAMNGTKHGLDEEFGSHPQCRCAPIPETKSFDSILSGLGIDSSDIPETSIDIPSGESWFNQQSEDVQRQILGNSAYDVWVNNDNVTLNDFVTHQHDADWGSSIKVTPLKDLVK